MSFRILLNVTFPRLPLPATIVLALLMILTLLPSPPRAVPQLRQPQQQVRVSPVREHMLVSTQWLAGHLTDSAVVILHVARERADYDAGHIPGARFLAVDQITVTRGKVSNELAPAGSRQVRASKCISDLRPISRIAGNTRINPHLY